VLGLLFLALAVLPLGLLLIRGLERFLGRRLGMSAPERLLVALYASGGLLFLVASIPLPIFGLPIVPGLLVVGAIGIGILWLRERAEGLRGFVRWASGIPALLLGAGSLGLLALEVGSVASLSFANTYDGATHALFANLILRNHTLPWTLAPYANTGVEYPQGAPVWETLPTLLLGWPVLAGPVLLPTLFLSLTPVAAFSLGVRLNESGTVDSNLAGLLFAGFFGLVAAWPRLFVGGSYDFAVALPLFLLVLGWIAPLTRVPPRPWREVAAFGALVGVATSLSAMIGLELLLLAGVFWFATAVANRGSLKAVAGRWLVTSAITVLFLSRSILGVVLWRGYPGYILSDAGSPPYVTLPATLLTPSLTYRSVTGELDPFVLWKYKLSPIASMSLLLAILVGVGLVLLAVRLMSRGPGDRWGLPDRMVRTILLGAITTFATTALILIAGVGGFPLSVQTLTNVEEFSIVLFVFYELIALLPLVTSLGVLASSYPGSAKKDPAPAPRVVRVHLFRRLGRPVGGPPPRWKTALAVGCLLVTFGLGTGTTVLLVPNYLHDHVQSFANVTSGDLAALEWAGGGGLPGCSRVLVAPGSAAEYLPEYGEAHVLFPAFPPSYNLSYVTAVAALTDGVYNSSVRADLVQLEVTEVFVTGPNSVEFPAFQSAPLLGSTDFSVVFHDDDAYVFEFLTGAATAGCSA
jgi:hypothetical protein